MSDDKVQQIRVVPAWRRSVWFLRAGFAGLAEIILMVIIIGPRSTAGRVLLSAGVVEWIICSIGTIWNYVLAVRTIEQPRPGFWTLRWVLIGDAFRRAPKK